MTGSIRATVVKFGIFALVMVVLTGCLIAVFGQYRAGDTRQYSAVFADVSRLKVGQSVRVAGLRVGTVNRIALRPDKTVVVTFDADRDVALTIGTHAAIRYLNLVGDRYLELVYGPGSSRLTPGAQIPLGRTAPALDLDLLLGGLKPVIRGLNPHDVNALSASLIQVLQGQGDTLHSIFAQTASFTAAMADRSQVITALIDNLHSLLAVLTTEGDQFSATIDRLQRLATQLSAERDPIGTAIAALDAGSASIADLLGNIRSPLTGTIDQLSRLAPNLNAQKDRLDTTLHKAPENYRKLIRIGSYGSFVNYYLCSLAFRVTDLQGRTAVFPWWRQETGRCSEP